MAIRKDNTYPSLGVLEKFGQVSLFTDTSGYLTLAKALYDDSFEFLSDLCGVDYLSYSATRELPDGVEPLRFEVAVNLLSMKKRQRIKIRALIGGDNPEIDSLIEIFPGCENFEREVYDMFGIKFRGHPDLSRILMPEGWQGHPLRKDYPVSRVPVQFKESPGPR